MIYRIIKFFAIIGLNLFFKKIVVSGKGRLPLFGPVLLAANHPNTLMDPMLVSYTSSRNPHVLAKSTLFDNNVLRWIFTRLPIIPVYRKADVGNNTSKNEMTFEACYDFLSKGKSIMIFPEGISQMDRQLHPIKTGITRIGLGAELAHNFELGVTIMPIGINYSDPTSFYSNVYVKYGNPIKLQDYRQAYYKDEIATVNAITEKIRSDLEYLTATVQKSEVTQAVEALEIIYKKELMVDESLLFRTIKQDFLVTKGIIDAVHWLYDNNPIQFNAIFEQLQNYMDQLKLYHLEDEFLSDSHTGIGAYKISRAIFQGFIGLPLFLFGFLTSGIPYQLPRLILNRINIEIEYYSTVKFLVGIVAYLIVYSLEIWLVAAYFQSPFWTIMFIFLLLPSGKYSLFFKDKLKEYWRYFQFLVLRKQQPNLVIQLKTRRNDILEILDDLKHIYLNQND